MSRSISMIALGTALWLLGASAVLAADKAPVSEPQLRIGEAAIEQALAEPTQMEFVETPLADVIDYLKGHRRVEIQLDNKALTDAGIGTDTPVTKKLKGISLRSALNLLLRDLNLTWIIQNEVLLITSPEEAENRLATKAYDVADLVVCKDSKGVLWDDYDSLIEVITDTAKPTTWDHVGGPGSITGASLGKGKLLIVSQTYEVQGEIAKLLADIREISKKSPDAEPPSRDKKTSPAKRAAGPSSGATPATPPGAAGTPGSVGPTKK